MSKILDALNAIYKSKKKLEGITQDVLAERMGVTQSAVCQYLKGDSGITIEMLERFCDAFGVKLSDLETWNPELAAIRSPRKGVVKHGALYSMLGDLLEAGGEWSVAVKKNIEGLYKDMVSQAVPGKKQAIA